MRNINSELNRIIDHLIFSKLYPELARKIANPLRIKLVEDLQGPMIHTSIGILEDSVEHDFNLKNNHDTLS